MLSNDLIIGLTVGVVSSLLASCLYSLARKQRAKSVRNEIEELKNEEEFLDRISKGNVQLLRSCFTVLFGTIGIIALLSGIFILVNSIEFFESVRKIVQPTCGFLIFIAGGSSFSYSRSILKLKNLSETKNSLQAKRDSLEKKINKA